MQTQRYGFLVSAIGSGWVLGVVGGLASLAATACFNPDERCSEDQEYSEADQLCVCRTGFTLTAKGCEKPVQNTPEDTGESPTGHDAGADSGAPPVEKGPEGLGVPCTSDDDCTGSEATFCDTLITSSCLVQDCALEGSDCPPGYECQDLSGFGAAGNVCVAAPCELEADDCPDGFTCCAAPVPGFPATCRSTGCED